MTDDLRAVYNALQAEISELALTTDADLSALIKITLRLANVVSMLTDTVDAHIKMHRAEP